ncbi:MAG: hypothetical protein ACRYHQ_41645 [Janthinobacterium lividum]
MSQGLGNRQRLLLAAAVQVEGGYRQGAWLPLAMVLRAVWTPEIAIEAEAAAVARVDREATEAETCGARRRRNVRRLLRVPLLVIRLRLRSSTGSRRWTRSVPRSLPAAGRSMAGHHCCGIQGPSGC